MTLSWRLEVNALTLAPQESLRAGVISRTRSCAAGCAPPPLRSTRMIAVNPAGGCDRTALIRPSAPGLAAKSEDDGSRVDLPRAAPKRRGSEETPVARNPE